MVSLLLQDPPYRGGNMSQLVRVKVMMVVMMVMMVVLVMVMMLQMLMD